MDSDTLEQIDEALAIYRGFGDSDDRRAMSLLMADLVRHANRHGISFTEVLDECLTELRRAS